jgi:sterol 24-C-methyltransferase
MRHVQQSHPHIFFHLVLLHRLGIVLLLFRAVLAMDVDETQPLIQNDTRPPIREDSQLQKYYASFESRLGYRLVLSGTRHFGYYEFENASPFPIGKALRRMEDLIYEELDLPPESEVLDAGCGVGHVAIHLAGRGLRIQAIDIVKRHVERAKQNVRVTQLENRIGVQHMDYHSLANFRSGQFDGMYTCETFVHANDPETALAEFFRVLKPGGRLVQHEYDHQPVESFPTGFRDKLERVNDLSSMPGWQRFGPGVHEGLLEEAGFVDIKVEDITKNVMPLLWLFFLMAIIPYYIIRFLRLEAYFVNTIAGAEGYWAMKKGYTRYVVVTARKPDIGEVAPGVATEAKKTR